MDFDGFATLPSHANKRLARFMSGDLPPEHRNMGIRPDLWLKEAEVGRVLYQWPNDGSRDIASGRMATALEDGEGFTTQDLQVKIFRPVSGDLVEIEAWVKNRSKTI